MRPYILAMYGWLSSSFYFPGRAGSNGVTFTNLGLILFICALITAAINALLVVVDHYDKRNNETQYKMFSRYLNVFGVIFIISAFGYQYVHSQKPVVVISNGS
ncbi:hypothetical protein [Paraglaciecola sp. T6c]|uniref:hypothetical protein n=1 Tax=Pseudoalteromonas atlantica (strain T6c / ATCC BAA-1087) TaxID=3042615 RepID=UPI0012EE627D|nr:hypothetical protein [Paraglaciecola sp. T6c]